jgi:alpha-amylase
MREIKQIQCVGEYWNRDMETLKWYIYKTNSTIPLFDVPLHYNFYEASNSFGNYDLRRIFDG